MIVDYLQEVLSEVGTKKKTGKRVTFLAKTKGGMRNYLLEVICRHLRQESKNNMLREQKSYQTGAPRGAPKGAA